MLIYKCIFDDATMAGALIYGAKFHKCSFIGTDFYWAMAIRSKFVNCSFQNVRLNGANLAFAVFKNCELTHVDFGKDNLGGSTTLHGTKFEHCKLSNNIFKDAEYDKKSVLSGISNNDIASMKHIEKSPYK